MMIIILRYCIDPKFENPKCWSYVFVQAPKVLIFGECGMCGHDPQKVLKIILGSLQWLFLHFQMISLLIINQPQSVNKVFFS